MKFQAFLCECGQCVATAEESPVCNLCGKKMKVMAEKSEEYKEFDRVLRKKLQKISRGV